MEPPSQTIFLLWVSSWTLLALASYSLVCLGDLAWVLCSSCLLVERSHTASYHVCAGTSYSFSSVPDLELDMAHLFILLPVKCLHLCVPTQRVLFTFAVFVNSSLPPPSPGCIWDAWVSTLDLLHPPQPVKVQVQLFLTVILLCLAVSVLLRSIIFHLH